MDLKYLAEQLYRVQQNEATHKRFMFNIHHPVIDELYDRFRYDRGILAVYPPDDTIRVEFELLLLNSAVVLQTEAFVRKQLAVPEPVQMQMPPAAQDRIY